ncbi:MAG: hypothetical protein JNL39_15325 [Opitutaceae bacterium]|nr:hypothetical protein [Opitutaceae bacterium]
MIRRLAFFLAAATAACAAAPSPLERDLGQGLAYVRVKRLPADLPAHSAGPARPCVIDVRYTEADAVAATTFAAWLGFRATPRAPMLVLANTATSPALLDALARPGARPSVIVIGAPGARFAPDLAVSSTAAEERTAYDALENGAAPDTLLADFPDKVRNDEASLVRGQSGPGETPADAPPEGPAERRSAPVIDAALQRAVHLHRALVALRKL